MSSGFMPQLEASSTSLGDAASAPMPSDASARTTGGNGLAFHGEQHAEAGKGIVQRCCLGGQCFVEIEVAGRVFPRQTENVFVHEATLLSRSQFDRTIFRGGTQNIPCAGHKMW